MARLTILYVEFAHCFRFSYFELRGKCFNTDTRYPNLGYWYQYYREMDVWRRES